jgi:hypothetical protein
LSPDTAWRGATVYSRRQTRGTLRGSVGVLALAAVLTVAFGFAPASAKTKAKQHEGEHVSKAPFGDIPKGPLQIFISINQQRLFLYSDGKLVADAPVSTGVPGHLTPMGVFSIIDKDRFHHSNLYSNAPMPYMQRITWSGVALHAGVLPGYPASHGCIRLPERFAVRLWGMTKRGERVIIARNELKPVEFADPHLFVHKDRPQDQAAVAPAATPSVRTAQTLDDGKTNDAASLLSAGLKNEPAKLEPVADKTAVADAPKPAVASEPATSDQTATDVAKADAPKPAIANEPANSNQPTADTAKPETATAPDAPTPAPAAADSGKINNITAPDAGLRPAVNAAPDKIVSPPAKPIAHSEATAVSKAPIAIFISRKEKKIYVRQHFAPLFDAPITIEHPEQALGTHVFTAMGYLDGDSTTFRWNEVSLPADPSRAARISDDEPRSGRHARDKRREEPAKVVADPPAAPADALARIEIPQDVVDRISEMMVPGSSLIVSDQGLGEETGEGTDFIVVTR